MLQNQMLNKTKQSLECRIITMCIVIFLCLQLILQFLNQECYFLLSGFYFPLVVVCFFGVLLTMKRINHFNGQTILSIVLLAIVLINCIIHNEYVDRGYLLTYVLIFTVMFVFSLAKFTKKQFKLMSYSYVLAAVIITLFMIVFRVRYYALDVTRITINVFGNTKIDPNYLAGFLVAPVFIALKGWGEEEPGSLRGAFCQRALRS